MTSADHLAYLADLEFKLQVAKKISEDDEDCAVYLLNGRMRIIPRLMLKKQKYGGNMDDIVAEFVRAVHARHESGLPLS